MNIYDLGIAITPEQVSDLVDKLTDEQAASLLFDWDLWRLPHQQAPPGDWKIWLMFCGRGTGKTHGGSKQVNDWARDKEAIGRGKIVIAGRTFGDTVDSLVKGDSGIIAQAPADFRPVFRPGQKRLTWPNGVSAMVASGDEPASFRRINASKAWCDELAHWQYPNECFDEGLLPALRVGRNPQALITTSPTSHPLIQALETQALDPKDLAVVLTRAATRDNPNLHPAAQEYLYKRYGGTRIGRQELDGEVLRDGAGALWKGDWIHNRKRPGVGDFDRIVVAIDPVGSDGTKKKNADLDKIPEAGITVAGKIGDKYWVIEDLSRPCGAEEWAAIACEAYHRYGAEVVLGEVNFGGDMVGAVLRASDPTVNFKKISASRGKRLRAEPVVALYEQGLVYHDERFDRLEEQMVKWVPGSSKWSPDRIDSMVYAITELAGLSDLNQTPVGSLEAYMKKGARRGFRM